MSDKHCRKKISNCSMLSIGDSEWLQASGFWDTIYLRWYQYCSVFPLVDPILDFWLSICCFYIIIIIIICCHHSIIPLPARKREKEHCLHFFCAKKAFVSRAVFCKVVTYGCRMLTGTRILFGRIHNNYRSMSGFANTCKSVREEQQGNNYCWQTICQWSDWALFHFIICR